MMRLFKIAALAAFLLLLLSGCGHAAGPEEPVEREAVCYVVAHTSNNAPPNLDAPVVRDVLDRVCFNYGMVGAIRCDGVPELVMQRDCDIEDRFKRASMDRLKLDADAKAISIVKDLKGMAAREPEVDYFEALHLAARFVAAQKEECPVRTIVVTGTGISTCGVLDFRNNLLAADPETVVEMLRERGEIPDLTGVTVCFQMGDTAGAQPKLRPVHRERVAQIYRGIVEAGGGTCLIDETPTLVEDTIELQQLPPVSCVEPPEELPIRFEPESPDAGQTTFRLDEEEVRFLPDRDVYADEAQAMKALAPLAEVLKQHAEVRYLVVGTTAGDVDDESTIELSRCRAQTVCRTLVALGVREDQLEATGLGSGDPWHISGAGVTGPLAAQNRKVMLLPVDSDAARQIRDPA